MSKVTAHAARRFRRLLESIRNEYGGERGWMTAAAKTLGVHRSTISKVWGDERAVTDDLVARATDRLALSASYWDDDDAADWRDHVVSRPLMSGLRDADARDLHEALDAAEKARDTLRQWADGSGRPAPTEQLRALLRAVERVQFFRVLNIAMADGEKDPNALIRLALDLNRFIEVLVPEVLNARAIRRSR